MLQNHHISSGVNVLETRHQGKLRPDIEPFPTHFVQCWTLKNGIPATVRTLSGSDEPLITRFHQQLSARSIYLRYFGLPTLAQRVILTLSCLTDDRELALVAVTRSECDSGQEVVGVAQMKHAARSKCGGVRARCGRRVPEPGLGQMFVRLLV